MSLRRTSFAVLVLVVACGEAGADVRATRLDVRAQLRAQLVRAPVERVRRADGVTSVRVQGGFQHATLVVRRPDGTLARGCFDQADEALRWLEADR